MARIRKLAAQSMLISAIVSLPSTVLAAPPNPPGRIAFIGRTANGQYSVWLSAVGGGMFEVQARNQTVDEWTQAQRGLHVTFSPIVSNGSGDPHSLYELINGGLVFLDKDTQQDGITFPPFPGGLPPGEVTPPIALPPGQVTPPIYIPPGGSIPPGGTTPPGGTLPPTGGTPIPESSNSTPNINADSENFADAAPITPGRRFARQPLWNVWVDARYFSLIDHRFGLDLNGDATNLTVGADRRVNNDLVIGAMLSRNTGESSSFDDTWQNNARGFNIGPYFGYRFLPNWAMDATLGYGQLDNHNDLSILNSDYTTHVYSTSLQATGNYDVANLHLRPKPAIYYTYFHSSSYNMNGAVNGNVFTVPIAADNFSYGFAQFAVEASRTFLLAHGNVATAPYVELGVDYAFARPNGGKILTGSLTMEQTSPWSGLARVGARTLITRSVFVEAAGSYLSLGQPRLNVWEGRLYISWALY